MSLSFDPKPSTPASPPPIAIPGRNCWRLAPASRAAFLIDASTYFAAFAQAVENARRSIFIIAWDVHSQTRLRPDQPPGRYPDTLGPFLDAVVRERHDLQVYILTWDYNLVYALEREPLASVPRAWKTHPRRQFCLDNRHPIGASLHQKIVVVDDAIAFSGGLDLTIRRWDTPAHRLHHPARLDQHGVAYAPFHDIQLLVDGQAAQALAALARERWFHRTGQVIPPTPVDTDPWPQAVQPDVTDVEVSIARTEPAYAGRPAVREVEALYLDAIAAAQRSIYIENQYFTSQRMAEALGARLSEVHGPEVLIVGPAECTGWIEQRTVGLLRDRFIKRLQGRDRFGRLRCVYPVQRGLSPCAVFVHAKICLIDETFARVGSANLTNRSLSLDTECDLAIEARGNPRIAAAIAHLRHRLLGEHLGVAPEQVAEALAATGSLLAAVDTLENPARGFAAVVARGARQTKGIIPVSAVFDPEGQMDPTELITKALPGEAVKHSHWPLAKFACVLTLLVLLGSLWRWTPLSTWISPDRLGALQHTVNAWPLAPLVVSVGIAVGSLMMIPLPLLVVQAAFFFGPVLGFCVAFTGALAGAVAAFLLGRRLGRDGLQSLTTPRLERLCRGLARRGVLAVTAIRFLPVAPFALVNLILGAARIKLWHFTLGTALGLLPGFSALAIFGDRLSATLQRPIGRNVILLGLVAIALIVSGTWLVRRVQQSFYRGAQRG